MASAVAPLEEFFDVLTSTGEKTGVSKPRSLVHKDGDYHRAVHIWIYSESTQELLLQRRAASKDSWPGLWDISSAGHIAAGDSSLYTARRELHEELGIYLPLDAFELLFVSLQECIINDGNFINNEFEDVYLITTLDPIPFEAFTLQESEVSSVKYISWSEYRNLLANNDKDYVPYDVNGQYGKLFSIIEERYIVNAEARTLSLQKKIARYVPVTLYGDISQLSEADREALIYIIKASKTIDEIFYKQVWYSNSLLRDWLKEHSDASELQKLNWMYYCINKGPWSVLDDNSAFLSTANSAVRLADNATRPTPGWEGIQYRAGFPVVKPPGGTFYPPDMDKKEFELWKGSLSQKDQEVATGYFNVIRRRNDPNWTTFRDACNTYDQGGPNLGLDKPDLQVIPYSEEYRTYLSKASEFLSKAAEVTDSPSLQKLLKTKADAFLSNNYYDSDIAWMELDSKLDITIGPYETYEDELFGYKASFEAFVGIRDDIATSQIKLFGDNLQMLEENLPLDNKYKSKNVRAAAIRVIQLIYNSGDVAGPQTVAFNLPNDERIVKDRGTSMVMLKNVQEAKFKHILQPIGDICINEEQKGYINFEAFYTHTICHECCHGIGPHTITLPSGKQSTVRLELQEFHSALEEAKADIVGLWALRFLINKELLPKDLLKSMYVSFLAGCIRSVRFGLGEAHGKGQALQFNWLREHGGFVCHSDGTFSVDFMKVEAAVESLSREIMTIQAKGEKPAAGSILEKYGKMTEELDKALDKVANHQVPVDITPRFTAVNRLLGERH